MAEHSIIHRLSSKAEQNCDRLYLGCRAGRQAKLGQQAIEIQFAAAERDVALRVTRPLIHRAIPAQFEVVAVRILNVDRFVCPMVGDLAQRPVDRLQPPQGIRKPGAGWVADGDMMQSGYAIGLWRAASRFPGVEAQVVMVAACGEEEDVATRPPPWNAARFHDDIEAKNIDIEGADAIYVSSAQVNMANGDTRIDRARGGRAGHNRALRLLISCAAHCMLSWQIFRTTSPHSLSLHGTFE